MGDGGTGAGGEGPGSSLERHWEGLREARVPEPCPSVASSCPATSPKPEWLCQLMCHFATLGTLACASLRGAPQGAFTRTTGTTPQPLVSTAVVPFDR